ncbi:hypothetical protein M0811_03131 [Anaeramoeba ignava]|uniref:Uncharacterized protein n=1 Tax=Anaeramoeba ignava TaxID=1746090 RepID=A0A9Q0L5Q1_ANAIG|nr:hypothetical protein M0811_03131 [Anaeramoeba ignava]
MKIKTFFPFKKLIYFYFKIKKYKKSKPGNPSFRIICCDSLELIPSIQNLNILRNYSDPIPLKFMILQSGNLIIISLDKFKAKTETKKERNEKK